MSVDDLWDEATLSWNELGYNGTFYQGQDITQLKEAENVKVKFLCKINSKNILVICYSYLWQISCLVPK